MKKMIKVDVKDYIDEIIEDLDHEITEKKKKKKKVGTLSDKVRLQGTSSQILYQFTVDNTELDTDNYTYYVCYKEVETACEIISVQDTHITLSVQEFLPEKYDTFYLSIDDTALLEKLKENYEKVKIEKCYSEFQLAADIFNGKLKCHRPEATVTAGEYKRLNQYQLDAVNACVKSDTIIWGPPGTGKTETIASAIKEHLKLGHRVLLLSHANTAVDGALKRLAALLVDDALYLDGKIVRLGTTHNDELKQFSMLCLDDIVKAKAAGLREEIDALQAQIEREQEKIAPLMEAQEKGKLAETLKREMERGQGQRDQMTAEITESQNDLRREKNKLTQLETKRNSYQSPIRRLFAKESTVIQLEADISTLKTRIEHLNQQINDFYAVRDKLEEEVQAATEQYEAAFQEYKNTLGVLGLTPVQLQARLQESNRAVDKYKKEIADLQGKIAAMRQQVVSEASVIGTTITQTFTSKELSTEKFDCLFIDEISMAPLVPVFWAISHIKESCVFIGDFLQLPPIGSSEDSLVRKWQRSLFEVLDLSEVSKAVASKFVSILKCQYRMNPAIADISNRLFYDGLLENGDNTIQNVVEDAVSGSAPLVFVDTTEFNPKVSKGANSRFNVYNACVAVNMAIYYIKNFPTISVGVVMPYSPQVRLARKILQEKCSSENIDSSKIAINTVHSFQGGENEVIIFDSVEGEGSGKWYFLDEGSNGNQSAKLLLNVAITRAKSKLIVLGNKRYIEENFSEGAAFKKMLTAIQEKGIVLNSIQFGEGFFADADNEDADEKYLHDLLNVSDSQLKHYRENDFWGRFLDDLQTAKERVIIFSPFIASKRLSALRTALQSLIARGVHISVISKCVCEHAETYRNTAKKLLHSLEDMNISVTKRYKTHEKIIFIDNRILWEGSLNLLSFHESHEQMVRISGSAPVEELSELLNMQEILGLGGNSETLTNSEDPYCEYCGVAMVERVNGTTKEPFYACPHYPNCRFTRNY